MEGDPRDLTAAFRQCCKLQRQKLGKKASLTSAAGSGRRRRREGAGASAAAVAEKLVAAERGVRGARAAYRDFRGLGAGAAPPMSGAQRDKFEQETAGQLREAGRLVSALCEEVASARGAAQGEQWRQHFTAVVKAVQERRGELDGRFRDLLTERSQHEAANRDGFAQLVLPGAGRAAAPSGAVEWKEDDEFAAQNRSMVAQIQRETAQRADDILVVSRTMSDIAALNAKLGVQLHHQGKTIAGIVKDTDTADVAIDEGNDQLAEAIRPGQSNMRNLVCSLLLGASACILWMDWIYVKGGAGAQDKAPSVR